jgi:hypothetical protein
MARQHGLITRSQALSTGLSRRQVDGRLASGEWHKLMPTVRPGRALCHMASARDRGVLVGG